MEVLLLSAGQANLNCLKTKLSTLALEKQTNFLTAETEETDQPTRDIL